MSEKPIVIMHYDENGWLDVRIAGEVTVLTVDDRVPADRIYEHTIQESHDELLAFADGPWGNINDDRTAQLRVKLHRLEHGLTVVGGDA